MENYDLDDEFEMEMSQFPELSCQQPLNPTNPMKPPKQEPQTKQEYITGPKTKPKQETPHSKSEHPIQ
jgi:hypothetical protein